MEGSIEEHTQGERDGGRKGTREEDRKTQQ